jgi:hypothetical protein
MNEETTQDSDILDRLHMMPCTVFCSECTSTVLDAMDEIIALREIVDGSSQSCDRSSDEMMASLSKAILNTEPCGRSDCIAVGPKFLSNVRNEMARLREIVALGACVCVAAKQAWLKSDDASKEFTKLISAVRAFEESRA